MAEAGGRDGSQRHQAKKPHKMVSIEPEGKKMEAFRSRCSFEIWAIVHWSKGVLLCECLSVNVNCGPVALGCMKDRSGKMASWEMMGSGLRVWGMIRLLLGCVGRGCGQRAHGSMNRLDREHEQSSG